MALTIFIYGSLFAAVFSLFLFYVNSRDDSKDPTARASEVFANTRQEAWGIFKFNMILVSIGTVAALLFE